MVAALPWTLKRKEGLSREGAGPIVRRDWLRAPSAQLERDGLDRGALYCHQLDLRIVSPVLIDRLRPCDLIA